MVGLIGVVTGSAIASLFAAGGPLAPPADAPDSHGEGLGVESQGEGMGIEGDGLGVRDGGSGG